MFNKKEWMKNYCSKYYQNHKKELQEYNKEYYYSGKGKEANNKYLKSKKGKIAKLKIKSKRRKLGFNILFEDIIDEKINWHHINNIDVVAIPIDLHQLYLGKNHRENMEYIIKQIYR